MSQSWLFQWLFRLQYDTVLHVVRQGNFDEGQHTFIHRYIYVLRCWKLQVHLEVYHNGGLWCGGGMDEGNNKWFLRAKYYYSQPSTPPAPSPLFPAPPNTQQKRSFTAEKSCEGHVKHIHIFKLIIMNEMLWHAW